MQMKTASLLALALSVLAADQVTKYLAVSRLTSALDGRRGVDRVAGYFGVQNLDNRPRVAGREKIERRDHRLLEDYWHFRYVENPGAAWGLFADLPGRVRGPFFAVVSTLALLFILLMVRRAPVDQALLRFALALVLGGALGNFLDRLVRGYVIDFIDWHWRNQPGLRWPTFNVADVAISVGVALMVFDATVHWAKARRARRAAGEALPEDPGPPEIDPSAPADRV